jgi:hypothetical protein
MKIFKIVMLAALILIPAASIFYKVNLKKVSFIPRASSNQWNIELSYDLKEIAADQKKHILSLPLITSWHNQQVEIKQVVTSHRYNLVPGFGSRALEIIPDKKGSPELGKATIIASLSKKSDVPGEQVRSRIYADRDEMKKKYTTLDLLPEEEEAIRALNKQIVSDKDDSLEKIRKIYYYITEEVLKNPNADNITDVVNLREGSDWAQALLFSSLARVNKIPARISLAYKYSGQVNKGQMGDLKKTYFPEVLIGDYWYPIDLLTSTFMRVPDKHFIIYQDAEQIRKNFKNKHFQLNIAPVMMNKVDSKAYANKLSGVSRILSYLSLHSLPIAQQSTFYIILLIPIGTLLLSVSRNIIGVNSFGIFTPILLTLFFIETSFFLGMIFFFVIVLIGFAQRFLLDKFYLLAVPRLSILLTLVIIVYMLFSLIFYQEFFISNEGGGLNYFPIVIITIFIERFSVTFIEEGFTSTLKTLFGTFFIAILCYAIFRSETLRLTVFNHPEILFSVIGFNFIIGSYKGYRISELIRFQELTKGH